MRIGLLDVDSRSFPNIPLMKLSAYHKKCGDTVEWYSPFGERYDRVYMSKVFSFTPDYLDCINADEVAQGGTCKRVPIQEKRIQKTCKMIMEKFEFKSAICTTVEQSKRLLKLGLKKETADMCLEYSAGKYYPKTHRIYNILNIPAWSLHRIVEIMFKGDIEGFVGYNIHANSVNIMYEYAISNIEALIKMGSFNKDYLEEKK